MGLLLAFIEVYSLHYPTKREKATTISYNSKMLSGTDISLCVWYALNDPQTKINISLLCAAFDICSVFISC